ncbi:hypothetical protein AJ80_07585 [Polytolypa hystricis UAMH7299]|uniref:RFX-type winged-helix domain-containing protein n=1 Tax=Polytolypa hystricis (strain UAMH7299) TaxID=1447883 RepID=A0A2B7XEP8_POLH7|nr:hypothetical protein AJ80_07585 [Polytolypa hystricis UAMH7299]
MPPDISGTFALTTYPAREPSQSSTIPPQTSHQRSRSRQSTIEPPRSRSNTAASRITRPPRSRGSTASIQSTTTQYMPEQHVPEGYQPYMHPEAGQVQHLFHSNPEEMIIRFGDQLANSNSGTILDPALQENHNSVRPRADMDFQAHDFQNHGLSIHGMASDLPSHALVNELHHAQYASAYEGIENQAPEHMLADNDGSEAGPRKRRAATSTIANDNELRRLLRQYDGYSLHQMAAEVQKHEGAGGKSEKVKQVFAMIWLRENCQRDTGSVRRDKVYCCYAEKCGSERVSVLNPASFGKLVRIIFPNVQTRRLGVRGESKYHYVDLSIKEIEPPVSTSPSGAGEKEIDGACEKERHASIQQQSSRDSPQITGTTNSTTPPRSSSPKSQSSSSLHLGSCACKESDHSSPTTSVLLDRSIMRTRQMVQQMLHFPNPNEPTPIDNQSLQLPNIHNYTPANTDPDVADALVALYRSHCISVIDSFRYCKEKNLMRHFSSFQGTLTVPVHKLLVHADLVPWIMECDWMMYQKMISCVAQLTTQVVPDPVINTFKSISRNLASYIGDTMRSNPEHVVSARLIPVRVFCHLLKRLLDVNAAANAAATWLCVPDYRTKMWSDFATSIDPVDIVTKSGIPSCSINGALNILQEQVKGLLSPLNENALEGGLYNSNHSSMAEDAENFPDRWIAFILKFPEMFPRHTASCVFDRVDAVWTSILHRLTLAGAQSFSAWWMTKVFFGEMMLWQAEIGGFMKWTATSLLDLCLDRPPTSRTATDKTSPSQNASSTGVDSQPSATSTELQSSSNFNSPTLTKQSNNSIPDPNLIMAQNTPTNDDSAIDLGDESALLAASKYTDIMASDPADADGDVVVI